MAGIVGFAWWGKNKLTNIVEEQRDPVKREMRAKDILGATALPPGYHAGMSINVGLASTTSLSDTPMSGDDMSYGERGFIFNDSRKNSSTPWPAKSSLNGKPASSDPAARMPIGTSIHSGDSCAAS